ncbi:MAG: hypothetical protein M0R33_17830 [Methylomonas sp.]|uniref:hypothetical protein n=1 Tax=Methylomonas sp. TaxID=418 RepID=UPI0025FF5595|nr:hypothetical protein [Methylomonas sp.]MCK9608308.1 hypothetical protein [Methylomonas sp.]
MLNWIKTLAACDLNTGELDNQDFPIRYEFVLPPEMRELLFEKTEINRQLEARDNIENERLFLDEHELALS